MGLPSGGVTLFDAEMILAQPDGQGRAGESRGEDDGHGSSLLPRASRTADMLKEQLCDWWKHPLSVSMTAGTSGDSIT